MAQRQVHPGTQVAQSPLLQRHLRVLQQHPSWPPGVLHKRGGPRATDVRLLCRIRAACPACQQAESVPACISTWDHERPLDPRQHKPSLITMRCTTAVQLRVPGRQRPEDMPRRKPVSAMMWSLGWHLHALACVAQRTLAIARGTFMPAEVTSKSVRSSTPVSPALQA